MVKKTETLVLQLGTFGQDIQWVVAPQSFVYYFHHKSTRNYVSASLPDTIVLLLYILQEKTIQFNCKKIGKQ